jgi:hypothetical protein
VGRADPHRGRWRCHRPRPTHRPDHDAAAQAAITELTTAQLLEDRPGGASRIGLTDSGQARYRQIRTAVDQVVTRAYRDIPADDLATAARVLTLITARLNAETADA